jgi:hypothetical protein
LVFCLLEGYLGGTGKVSKIFLQVIDKRNAGILLQQLPQVILFGFPNPFQSTFIHFYTPCKSAVLFTVIYVTGITRGHLLVVIRPVINVISGIPAKITLAFDKNFPHAFIRGRVQNLLFYNHVTAAVFTLFMIQNIVHFYPPYPCLFVLYYITI